ncbi:MAG: hypothetical protein U1A27_14505 [Phycisphaerae bacterium]
MKMIRNVGGCVGRVALAAMAALLVSGCGSQARWGYEPVSPERAAHAPPERAAHAVSAAPPVLSDSPGAQPRERLNSADARYSTGNGAVRLLLRYPRPDTIGRGYVVYVRLPDRTGRLAIGGGSDAAGGFLVTPFGRGRARRFRDGWVEVQASRGLLEERRGRFHLVCSDGRSLDGSFTALRGDAEVEAYEHGERAGDVRAADVRGAAARAD